MKEIQASYDIIIVGAGVGGLTAAALLSKAGFTVCVLEKEPHVGGYLAGFRRKDFIFDTAIHWLNQYGPEGIVTRLFDAIGTDHPRAVTQKYTRRYKGKSFDYLLTSNPNELRDQLIGEFPHEKKRARTFFQRSKKNRQFTQPAQQHFPFRNHYDVLGKIPGQDASFKSYSSFYTLRAL